MGLRDSMSVSVGDLVPKAQRRAATWFSGATLAAFAISEVAVLPRNVAPGASVAIMTYGPQAAAFVVGLVCVLLAIRFFRAPRWLWWPFAVFPLTAGLSSAFLSAATGSWPGSYAALWLVAALGPVIGAVLGGHGPTLGSRLIGEADTEDAVRAGVVLILVTVGGALASQLVRLNVSSLTASSGSGSQALSVTAAVLVGIVVVWLAIGLRQAPSWSWLPPAVVAALFTIVALGGALLAQGAASTTAVLVLGYVTRVFDYAAVGVLAPRRTHGFGGPRAAVGYAIVGLALVSTLALVAVAALTLR